MPNISAPLRASDGPHSGPSIIKIGNEAVDRAFRAWTEAIKKFVANARSYDYKNSIERSMQRLDNALKGDLDGSISASINSRAEKIKSLSSEIKTERESSYTSKRFGETKEDYNKRKERHERSRRLQQLKTEQENEQRIANDNKSRIDDRKQRLSSAISYSQSFASSAYDYSEDVARGAGIKLSTDQMMHSSLQRDQIANQIVIDNNATNQFGPKRTVDHIKSYAQKIANETAQSPLDVLNALKLVANGTDLDTAMTVVPEMAKIAKANGNEISDYTNAAISIGAYIPDTPERGNKIRNILQSYAVSAKHQRLDVPEYMAQVPILAGIGSKFLGDSDKNMQLIGGFALKASSLGADGTSNKNTVGGPQAASAATAFYQRLLDQNNIDALESIPGVELFDSKTSKVTDLRSIAHAIATKTGGDPKELLKMFPDAPSYTFAQAITETYRNAVESSIKQGSTQMEADQAGSMALDAEFDHLWKNNGANEEIQEAFSASMKTMTSRAQLMQNKLDLDADKRSAATFSAFESNTELMRNVVNARESWGTLSIEHPYLMTMLSFLGGGLLGGKGPLDIGKSTAGSGATAGTSAVEGATAAEGAAVAATEGAAVAATEGAAVAATEGAAVAATEGAVIAATEGAAIAATEEVAAIVGGAIVAGGTVVAAPEIAAVAATSAILFTVATGLGLLVGGEYYSNKITDSTNKINEVKNDAQLVEARLVLAAQDRENAERTYGKDSQEYATADSKLALARTDAESQVKALASLVELEANLPSDMARPANDRAEDMMSRLAALLSSPLTVVVQNMPQGPGPQVRDDGRGPPEWFFTSN